MHSRFYRNIQLICCRFASPSLGPAACCVLAAACCGLSRDGRREEGREKGSTQEEGRIDGIDTIYRDYDRPPLQHPKN